MSILVSHLEFQTPLEVLSISPPTYAPEHISAVSNDHNSKLTLLLMLHLNIQDIHNKT